MSNFALTVIRLEDFSTKRAFLLSEKAYITLIQIYGSGVGTSGRAMGFCLGRPGLNPRTGLGFFSIQNCCQSILTGCVE